MSGVIPLNRHRLLKDICLPITVGYHVEQSSDSSRPIRRQDGFVSGWIFLTLLMALAVTLSLGHWMTTSWSKSIDKPTIQICGGTLQLLCCGFVLPILCNNRVRHLVSPTYQEANRNGRTMPTSCRQWTKKILPIIGITFFLIGMTTLDILKVAAYAFCIDKYQDLEHSSYPLKEAIVAIMYHPIRIIFTSMVTVLCYMYTRNELRFYRYCSLRYILLLVLGAVGWIWLDTLIQESIDNRVIEDAYSTRVNHAECALNSTKVDHFKNETQIQCLCKTTEMFNIVKKASEILYSFVIEFCLLVIECILHMLFSMADSKPEGNGGVRSDPLSNPVQNGPESGIAEDRGDSATENSPLLRHNTPSDQPYCYHTQDVALMESYQQAHSESSQSTASVNDAAEESLENPFPSNRMSFFFISLVLGLVFVIMTAMQLLPSVNDSHGFKTTYYTFKLCYHVVAIGVTAWGFKACRNFRSKHRGYMGFEMLTIFTSFGFFVYVFFILQANIAEIRGAVSIWPLPHPPSLTYQPALIVYSVDILVNTIQVYSQSLFMLHSSKIRPPAERRTRSSRESIYLFKQVLLYLATRNLFIWGLESFVEMQNVSEIFPFHSIYYGEANWQIVSHVAFPLMIFYRFNSCIYLIGIYLST